jgi:transcriptional regulator with XRE-family HTH domain
MIRKHKSGRRFKLLSKISDNFRTILSELNMSQVNFAKSVGASFGYINMIINSKRSLISRPFALLIEEKYGYSADWILYNEGEKKVCPFKTQELYKELKITISQLSFEDITDLFGFILFLEENEKNEKEKWNLKKQNHRSA